MKQSVLLHLFLDEKRLHVMWSRIIKARANRNEPPNDKTNEMACAPSEDLSLCTQCVAKDPSFLHVDSEDRSDSVDAESSLGARHFIGFVMRQLKCL